jgi:hypothetical protein
MPTFLITTPEGKKLRITAPEGATQEEVLARVKAHKPEPTFEEKVAAQREKDKITYDPTQDMSPAAIKSAMYTKGARESFRGARQLLNKLTGDDEELARLNEEEADIRRRDEPLAAREEGKYYDTAGKIVPTVAATFLATKAAPALPAAARIASPVLSTLAKLGISAGTGALTGGAGALTREEEEQGQRGTDAFIGGVLGPMVSTVPVALRGLGEVFRRTGRELPEEAVATFARKHLGAGSRTEAIDKLRELMGGKVDDLRGASRAAYDTAEQNPSLRPVDLSGAREVLGSAGDTLTGDITLRLNPQVGKVVGSLTGKADDAVSFGDVREAQRILKGKMRKLDPSSEAYQAYSGTHDLLDQQLSKWANQATPPLEQVLLGEAPALSLEAKHLGLAKEADAAYRRDVVPFLNRKKVLGQVYGGGEFPMGAENKLLNPAAGAEVRDLIERVPESQDAIKKLYGANLLDQSSTSGMANALSKPATDQILSTEERIMADKLIKALRTNGDGTSKGLIDGILRSTGRLERFRYGIDPLDRLPQGNNLLDSVYSGLVAGELGN